LRVVINIEANGLDPSKIWCIVCKDIDTGVIYEWRNPTDDSTAARSFSDFANNVKLWIGHNLIGYDLPNIRKLLNQSCGLDDLWARSLQSRGNDTPLGHIDTLIISKLVDYPREGHSTEHFAKEFGIDKPKQPPYSQFSEELVTYCRLLVEIGHRIYGKYIRFISNSSYHDAILLEHQFQLIVNRLRSNGFAFNGKKAETFLRTVETELGKLDKEIEDAFPPREVLIREFTPKLTKHGTISRSSVPRSLQENIHQYEAGVVYRHTKLEAFNPASHKQLIDVLTEAGWSPTDKTKTHLDLERTINKLKYQKHKEPAVDLELQKSYDTINKLKKYGWKINEQNLSTLPDTAPAPARSLAQRILLEARRRTLTEWLSLVQDDGRIHGDFYGIGAWTHRMAHQKPNTANIPNEFDTAGKKKLLGKEMRSLWCAPRNRLLVGVDAEGIQLRIFAHYINDPEFTKALVEGKKDDKSDPHSLNQRILGSVCKSRAAAKRFIYALLLGAGLPKLAEILGASEDETRVALDRLMERYTGFAHLKETLIPGDARRGYFVGLDGRPVRIPGDTAGLRRHLCMSGYLQNGEAVVMKRACVLWHKQLDDEEIEYMLVNFVHDEWQTECQNNVDIALRIAHKQADALRIVGEELGLKCPLAGSFYNEDLKDYTIATNWAYTH
jgi:DNA polymerase-1